MTNPTETPPVEGPPRSVAPPRTTSPDPAASEPRSRRSFPGLLSLARRYERLRGWRGFRDPRAVPLGLLAAVGGFAIFVGWIWSTRYWAFETAAWDLGVYHQAFYTTVFDHRFFYYTADLPAGTNGFLFSAHFSPFLLGLLPLYAPVPTPSTLLGIQALALASGAVPVYYLARRHLGPGGWPALFAGLYLLAPLTVGTGWYDFHPEAFLPVSGLTAIYLYERRRLVPFLAALLVALSVIETMAPFVIVFGTTALIGALWRRDRLGAEPFREELRFAGLATATAIVWLGISGLATFAFSSNGGTFGPAYGGYWSVLGASSILDVFPRAILSPGSAALALAHDPGPKALYVALTLGCFAFLPLFGQRRYLLPAAAWLSLALLSNHTGYYVLNDQYTGYLLPFLLPAAITGAEWWRKVDLRPVRSGLRSPALAGLLIAGVVVVSGVASPFLPAPHGSFNAVAHGLPTISSHDELLHQVIGLIPSSAGVLTTSLLFPEVSDRPNAYVLPISSLFLHPLTFSGVVATYVNESQFVLVDFEVDYTNAYLLVETANLTGFGLEAGAAGAYLYARDWSEPPTIWRPFSVTVAGGDLHQDKSEVDRTVVGPYGPTLLHPAQLPTGLFWDGPVVEGTPPGTYRITAHLEVQALSQGPQTAFAVLTRPIEVHESTTSSGANGQDYSFRFVEAAGPLKVLSNQTVTWNGTGNGSFGGDWTTLLDWQGPGILDTQGWVLAPGSSQRLDWISLVQISAD
ncbi:MAG TPA: DUF2079 domain-containing protein [Thermoplasmata archaeon]|nr:DUF2079 domain-containing protein [Thermoplasmata archaeon]